MVVRTRASPPPIGSRKTCGTSFSSGRTNAIHLPSGDHRGEVSRVPLVIRCGPAVPAAGTAYSACSYLLSFSFTVTWANATVVPSGEIWGSAIQVNL
jgi:hypothetical protein